MELAAPSGLRAGRVRSPFPNGPQHPRTKAAAELSRSHPGIELNLVDAHPADGLKMLRAGHVDIALIFRARRHSARRRRGFRLTHLLDDPLYLVSDQPDQRLEDHRDSAWVGGCERCRAATITACERAGFSPRIAHSCDDTVVAQSLVAAGMGVAIINGLALHAHRAPGIHATQLDRQRPPDLCRHVRRPARPTRHDRAYLDPAALVERGAPVGPERRREVERLRCRADQTGVVEEVVAARVVDAHVYQYIRRSFRRCLRRAELVQLRSRYAIPLLSVYQRFCQSFLGPGPCPWTPARSSR